MDDVFGGWYREGLKTIKNLYINGVFVFVLYYICLCHGKKINKEICQKEIEKNKEKKS